MTSQTQNAAPHRSRQDQLLLTLLQQRRTVALSTLDDDGRPYVSLAPCAWAPQQAGRCILQLSLLAAHTRHLLTRPEVSLLLAEAEPPDDRVHEMSRATLLGTAHIPAPGSAEHAAAQAVYLARFPAATLMAGLGDFRHVVIDVKRIRQIAGFGAARDLDTDALARLWPLS